MTILKATSSALTSALLLGTLFVLPAEADDKSDAIAASEAFYTAIAVLDDGSAMEQVFAQTPYVTFIGPMSKDIIVGWPALKNYFVKANAKFKSRKSNISKRVMRVNGDVAWEVGIEVGESEFMDGKKAPVDWVVTNVFERQADGKWLMVSHHVQPGTR